MARKRQKGHRSQSVSHRVTRRLQPFASFAVTPQRKLVYDNRSWIDDRRFTAPPAVRIMRPLYTVHAAPAVTRERFKNGRFHSYYLGQQNDPLTLCVRRRTRREVLFARGSGNGHPRRKSRHNRRTVESSISCR